MSDKSLGQVAKQAFLNATGPTGDDDWQVAAEAVVRAAEPTVITLDTLEMDVIEAAKNALQALVWAYHAPSQGDPQEPDYRSDLSTLFNSVEALQAVEGE